MKYSSPQALFNKFFRKDKFKITVGDEISYENSRWVLTHIEGEVFELIEKRYCNDIGHYDHEHGCDLLLNLVYKIRELK